MNAFDASIRTQGPTTVIDMTGLLDRSAEVKMNEVFAAALASGAPTIVFNFAAVEYINSTGIALVVGALAKARTAGRPVRAFGLSDHYREIFTITRLSDFMGIFSDESAAVAG
jgi:anti-anti-sigma factor